MTKQKPASADVQMVTPKVPRQRRSKTSAAVLPPLVAEPPVSRPTTDLVLVRSQISDPPVRVSIVTNDGVFDFTDYRYWRMSTAAVHPIEEWVYKDDIHVYMTATANNM